MNYNFSSPGPQPLLVAGPAWELPGLAGSAFFRTTAQMLLHPGRTLSGRGFPGYSSLLAYAVPCLVFSQTLSGLYESLLKGVPFVAGYWLLALPVGISIYLLASAGLLHLALLLVGGARNGWRSTFRAMAYISAGTCLLILPLAGPYLHGIWFFAALFPALAASHDISRLKVLGALLALIALFLLLSIVIGFVAEVKFLLDLLEQAGDMKWLKF
jgi:hypothetical protein